MVARLPGAPGQIAEQIYRGYDFHSRQPCLRITVQLPLGSLTDVAEIDRWLEGPFAITPTRLAAAIRPLADHTPEALATAVTERALLLIGEMLRGAEYPSFEHGKVLEVEALPGQPRHCRVRILLPAIDNVPAEVFSNVLKDVLKTVLTQLGKPPQPELVEQVWSTLNTSVVGKLAGIVKFNSSTTPICHVAHKLDIPYRHIGNGLVQFGWGAKGVVTRGSAVARDSAIGAMVCMYKQITAERLRIAGLPAARHLVVNSRGAALAAARELGWPVVVKPSNLERSYGVTAGIGNDAALLAAYDLASPGAEHTLVERHEPGICHRILIASGQHIYTVIRYAKGIIGNGHETVAERVASTNADLAKLPPWKRMKDTPLDDEALKCLADQGLTVDSIPADGERVNLRAITSGEWGGDIANLTTTIHPDNVALAISAANLLGLTVAGIDLMTVDISRPWHENNATIIEVNYDPQFALSRREDDAARLLPALVEGDGRIPVHLVTGEGDLLARAREVRHALASEGRAVHLTSAHCSEDMSGDPIVLLADTLFARSLALIMRPEVRELIVVGQPQELFVNGLAVDRLASLHIADSDSQRGKNLERDMRARFPIAG